MGADELRRLSDDELRRLSERLQALVPNVTHSERLSYEAAAERLGVKYERVAALVSRGVLIAEKKPRDARKWLSTDQVAWYELKQRGMDEGLPNPALLSQEWSRRRGMQAPSRDTLADVRAYVAERLADSPAAAQLNAALTEIAQHIASTLVRDTLGVETLPEAERAWLSTLLAALTQRNTESGRDKP